MGECMYYLKARFPKGTLTKKKFREILAFFKKNEEEWAYDCGGSNLEDRFSEGRDELGYVSEVSHMADWSNITEALTKKFGASKAIWGSEENGYGSLDSLQFENYEQIVQDILKKKEALLPGLLGINDELDALISDRLKGK